MSSNNLTWQDTEITRVFIVGVVEEWLHEVYATETLALRDKAKALITERRLTPLALRHILAEKIRFPEKSMVQLVEELYPQQKTKP